MSLVVYPGEYLSTVINNSIMTVTPDFGKEAIIVAFNLRPSYLTQWLIK
jgi:hypothetical protein